MRVIVSGGGTGGHIYPALAVINEVKRRKPNAEFLYIGSENGLERDIVEKEGISFSAIDIAGFKRKISLENLHTIIKFLKSVSDSKKLIKEFKPDIVVGTGGFVCGPVLYAASKLKIPTIIHEQNVIPGLTNKFLSKYVSTIAISFSGSKQYFEKHKNVVLTGNPRATEVVKADGNAGYEFLKISSNKNIILIFGGSRGAKCINNSFLEMLPSIKRYPDYHFIFVSGTVHYDSIIEKMKKDNLMNIKNVSVYSYLYNMPDILKIIDINVSRAGASTLAEVAALGIPSILIPSPYVTNNHQEKNAKWIEEQGAGMMIKETEINGETLLQSILQLTKDKQKYSASAKKIGLPDSASIFYNEIESLL